MLVGLVGIVLPVLPGTLLIFISSFLYALITGFEKITGQVTTHFVNGVIKGFEINFCGRDLDKLDFLNEEK